MSKCSCNRINRISRCGGQRISYQQLRNDCYTTSQNGGYCDNPCCPCNMMHNTTCHPCCNQPVFTSPCGCNNYPQPTNNTCGCNNNTQPVNNNCGCNTNTQPTNNNCGCNTPTNNNCNTETNCD